MRYRKILLPNFLTNACYVGKPRNILNIRSWVMAKSIMIRIPYPILVFFNTVNMLMSGRMFQSGRELAAENRHRTRMQRGRSIQRSLDISRYPNTGQPFHFFLSIGAVAFLGRTLEVISINVLLPMIS